MLPTPKSFVITNNVVVLGVGNIFKDNGNHVTDT